MIQKSRWTSQLLLFIILFGFTNLSAQLGSQAAANQTEFSQNLQASNSPEAEITEVVVNPVDDLVQPYMSPNKPMNWRTRMKETMLGIGLFSLGVWLLTFIIYLILKGTAAAPIFLALTIYALPLLAVALFCLLIAAMLPARRKNKRHFLFWTW